MEDKDQLRAILENAVYNGVMRKKKEYIDSHNITTSYYFPWSETAKKKEHEGQVNTVNSSTVNSSTDSTTTQVI